MMRKWENAEMEKDIQAIKARFRTWFNRRWAEMDAREGDRTTQQELADRIGITRSAVAQYASGRQIPDDDNLDKIAKFFGYDVYDVLEKPGPPDDFSKFPPEYAARLRKVAGEIEAMLNSGKFAPGSPEHDAAAREIFSRNGLDLKDIDIEIER
jgi:transcriptional regulator with XRE-family HTH domain